LFGFLNLALIRDFFLFGEFIRFSLNQEDCRKKWLAAVQEAQRLQRELEKANQNIIVLDAKLNHARRLLDKEKKKRLEAENNSTALVRNFNIFVCFSKHTVNRQSVPMHVLNIGHFEMFVKKTRVLQSC